ncbi:MAG: GAF domain-containing sensor histidine kinase [Pseudonocardiales bacterium]
MNIAADQQELLAAAGRLVTREPSLPVMLAGVARLLTETLSADGCLAYQIEASGELVIAATFPDRPAPAEPLRMPSGFGVTGRVAADLIPAVLVDDNPRNLVHRDLLGLQPGQLVSRLCVPARSPHGGCTAVLAVHSLVRREFTAIEIDAAQQVADLVGLRMQLWRTAASLGDFEDRWERLVTATVGAQEGERRRVAGDLHDGVTQALASLAFHLSAAEVALTERDYDYVSEQVRAARRAADLAFAEARNAIAGLHSPVLEDLGLAAGLVSMARAIPTVQVEVDAQDIELPAHVEAALFRIAQEAVQNVVKHAEAARALVSLVKRGRSVVLRVSDDGRGFDAPGPMSSLLPGRTAASQYGLTGMYERVQLLGGRISVRSRLGDGTTVEVVLPDSVS